MSIYLCVFPVLYWCAVATAYDVLYIILHKNENCGVNTVSTCRWWQQCYFCCFALLLANNFYVLSCKSLSSKALESIFKYDVILVSRESKKMLLYTLCEFFFLSFSYPSTITNDTLKNIMTTIWKQSRTIQPKTEWKDSWIKKLRTRNKIIRILVKYCINKCCAQNVKRLSFFLFTTWMLLVVLNSCGCHNWCYIKMR